MIAKMRKTEFGLQRAPDRIGMLDEHGNHLKIGLSIVLSRYEWRSFGLESKNLESLEVI
jgi:hypothetical protein